MIPSCEIKPERRLQADDVFNRRGSGDRTVRLGADRRRAQVRCRGGAGTGARSPGRVGQLVRRSSCRRRARSIRPPERRIDRSDEAAEVRPLAEVRLSEDHRAGSAQPRTMTRITRHSAAVDRQRPRRGLHVVVRGDVVFDQQRNSSAVDPGPGRLCARDQDCLRSRSRWYSSRSPR